MRKNRDDNERGNQYVRHGTPVKGRKAGTLPFGRPLEPADTLAISYGRAAVTTTVIFNSTTAGAFQIKFGLGTNRTVTMIRNSLSRAKIQ